MNKTHLALLKQWVKAWNKWREENWEVRLGLGGADLREADLSQATWTDGRTCKEGSIGKPLFEEENKSENA